MNSLKNLRRTLSPILLHYNPAVRPKLPPPSVRCYRTSPRRRRPKTLQPNQGRPSGGVTNPATNREPAPAIPRWYSSWSWRSFIRNPLSGGRKWYQDRRILYAAVATTGGVALTLRYGTFETVPYSNRTHFIIVTPSFERRRGESYFNDTKETLKKQILPPNHPDSIRVNHLMTEIVSAAHRGLAHNNLYADDDAARRGKKVLDEKSASVSRSRWKAEGAPLQTKHLDGLKWEVIVVKEKGVNAMCLPGGKIIVFTGLLDKFKTDAEVATVLGHEVGHVIARHFAEKTTRNIWLMILEFFIQVFCDASPTGIRAISSLLLRLPFSRRMELEADHIGILLLGAAGYDPHIAPSVYKKLGKINGDLGFFDLISTHPSSTKRARLLSEHVVMQEAMELYIQASAGKESKGFFGYF